MGVREEIEKLPICETPNWDDVVSRDDVLSILDEHLGECVGEIVCKEGQLNLEAFGKPFATLMKTSRVGDHISIYVRRKP